MLFTVFLYEVISLRVAQILGLEQIDHAMCLVVLQALGETKEKIAVARVGGEPDSFVGFLYRLVKEMDADEEGGFLGMEQEDIGILGYCPVEVVYGLLEQTALDFSLGTDIVELTRHLCGHQFLVFVVVVDCLTIFSGSGKSLGTGKEIGSSLLEIGLGECSHGTVEKGHEGCGVVEHLLAAGGSVECLRGLAKLVNHFTVCVIRVFVTL